jgi:hypothetical protein
VRFSCGERRCCLDAVYPRPCFMMMDGGTVIVLLYLFVSAAVITALLMAALGLEWFADRLRERPDRQGAHPIREQ